MTKRCIIVGAGEYFGIPFELRKDDFIIAADGGYEILKKEHIVLTAAGRHDAIRTIPPTRRRRSVDDNDRTSFQRRTTKYIEI